MTSQAESRALLVNSVVVQGVSSAVGAHCLHVSLAAVECYTIVLPGSLTVQRSPQRGGLRGAGQTGKDAEQGRGLY